MSGYVGITNTARKMATGYVGIPASYTQIEYIESTGTQYIDTGIPASATLKILCDMSTTTGGYPFGVAPAQNVKYYGTDVSTNNQRIQSYFGTTNSYTIADNIWTQGQRFVLTANDNYKFYKDNIQIADYTTGTTKEFDSSLPITIFALNGLYLSNRIKMKLYGFKMYDNGTLVRDFIPVIDQNNVACLYEQVEDKFYYNKGTGEFKYTPFNTDSYEPIEYIQSNGLQSINLGINAKSTTRIIMNFYLLSDANSQTFFSTSAGLQLRFIIGAQGKFAYSFNDNSTSWVDINLTPVVNKQYSIEFVGSAKKLNINGTWYNLIGNASIDSTDNLVILSSTQLRLYSIEVCQDGKATSRKLIPVKRKSDDEVCLYDLISKQFFTNAGSGNFIAGPNIGRNRPSPVSINPRARKLLKGFVGVKGKATLCYQAPHYKMLFDNGLVENGPKFEQKYVNWTGTSTAHSPTQQSTSVSDKLYVYCYQQSTSYNSTIGLVSSSAYDMSKYKAIFVKSKPGSYFLNGNMAALGVFREGRIDMRNGL